MNKRAFTVIELLIVLVLIGIVYGVYFYSMVKSKNPIPFGLDNMKQYMKNASKKYDQANLSLIYDFDNERIYLVNDKEKKILESIKFDEDFTLYELQKDENLEVKTYKNIEIDDKYFEPKMIYKNLGENIYSNIILNLKDGSWRYYNSFFGEDYVSFDEETQLIDYIKKTEYLPMSAGKPE